MKKLILLAITALVLAPTTAPAQNNAPKHDHKHEHKNEAKPKDEHKHDDHDHHHEAPHGGTLVILGDHFAMLELVLDPKEGSLTGYVLDGEGEKAVRLAQPNIELRISADSGKTTETITLEPVASPLTGEKTGDTSEFRGVHEKLKNLEKFRGSVSNVDFKGQKFTGIEFTFPEGNE